LGYLGFHYTVIETTGFHCVSAANIDAYVARTIKQQTGYLRKSIDFTLDLGSLEHPLGSLVRAAV
jgi:hypothetical protein